MPAVNRRNCSNVMGGLSGAVIASPSSLPEDSRSQTVHPSFMQSSSELQAGLGVAQSLAEKLRTRINRVKMLSRGSGEAPELDHRTQKRIGLEDSTRLDIL